ncbi:MAG: methionine--tRNA ligase [Patescibacteria group bacterium]
MTKNKEKFYITTSIAYTNSAPHIGFAFELIQADVIARYQRILGKDVWFLTGTDEHGTKIARKAKEEGKSTQDFCDEISAKFRALKEPLNLSFDDFIRTTDQKRHWPTVQAIWQKLKENGDIEKRIYQGLYCVGCEAFVTEKDLVEGKCPNHQKAPEVIEEENYFFKLSRYQSQLKEILEKDEIKIFPEGRKNEMLSFMKEGLEDVSCSRDKKVLAWGVPVPGDESQTVYVWFEAVINYVSALGYLTENDEKLKKYWPCDIHFIGKDITRFHTLLWPAMLLGLGVELPKNVFVHGYITVSGQKMSKSLGNVVDPFELVKKYGTDAVRYFLLREISSTEDGDFTYEKFEERYNADLANGIGNLLARVVTLASKIINYQLSIINQFSNSDFKTELEKTKKKYNACLENFSFNEALGAIWELISFCDKYVNDNKPWEGGEGASQVISDLLLALQEIAELLKPFMPQTAEKILQQIATGKSEPLFPRI